MDMTGHEILDLYHVHGKYGQFHSEINTDMDPEHLPSGQFKQRNGTG